MSDSGELIPITPNVSDAAEKKIRAAVAKIEEKHGLSLPAEGPPSVDVLARRTELQMILDESAVIGKRRARDDLIMRVWQAWLERGQITLKQLGKVFGRHGTTVGRWMKSGCVPDEMFERAKSHIERETDYTIDAPSNEKERYHVIIEATHQIRMTCFKDEQYNDEERLSFEEVGVLVQIWKNLRTIVEGAGTQDSDQCLNELIATVHRKSELRPANGRWRIRNPHMVRSLWSEWCDAYVLVYRQLGKMFQPDDE